MGWTRFRLLNKRRSFLMRFQFSPLLLHILKVFLVEVGLILLRKFSLFLELEDGGPQRSPHVYTRNVIFAHVNPIPQIVSQRLLLL